MLDCLRANPVFAELKTWALEELLDAANLRTVPAEGAIVRQGDNADCFGVISSGRAKMVQVTLDGRQVLLRYLVAGQEFGLIAVLPGNTYPVSIEAVEACQVLYWPGPALADAFVELVCGKQGRPVQAFGAGDIEIGFVDGSHFHLR